MYLAVKAPLGGLGVKNHLPILQSLISICYLPEVHTTRQPTAMKYRRLLSEYMVRNHTACQVIEPEVEIATIYIIRAGECYCKN